MAKTANKRASTKKAATKRSLKKAAPKKAVRKTATKKAAAPAKPLKLRKGQFETAKLVEQMTVTRGRLVRVFNQHKHNLANPEYTVAWLQDGTGKWKLYAFTERELKMATDRAKKNKEDWTKLTWVTDLPNELPTPSNAPQAAASEQATSPSVTVASQMVSAAAAPENAPVQNATQSQNKYPQ